MSLTSLTASTFFEVSDEVARKLNSYNNLPDYKQDAYEQKNKFIFDNADIMVDTRKEVNSLLKERNDILDDYTLSAEIKTKEEEIIEKDIYYLTRDANQMWFNALRKASSDL